MTSLSSGYKTARRTRIMTALAVIVLAGIVLFPAVARADRKVGTIGPPPRQNPQRQSNAEAVAPLPLPATPLRRSEPKAEPSPPIFIGKLKYGTTQDYKPNPGDVDNVLRHVRFQIDAWYGWQEFGLDELVGLHKKDQPCQFPMLYITGYQSFEFSPEERIALRDYLLDGGTLLGDATLGSPDFTASFRSEVAKMFPDRKLDTLQLDHGIFRGYYNYSNVHYYGIEQGVATKTEGPPMLLGMNIAARTAVILSPYDMSCGWDEFYAPASSDRVSTAARSKAMMPADAIRMGINIVAYVSAQRRFAKAQAQTRTIAGEQEQKRASTPIALLRHQGDWNPDPNALNQLIRVAAQQTSIPMDFSIKPVDPDINQLIDTPIVVMTGMDDPKLSDTQVDALRAHLQAGGFLFINNTSGYAKFDREVRALVKRIFPDQALKELPADHAVFTAMAKVTEARDAGTLKERPAELEGVTLGKRTVIIYSKNDTLALLKGVHDPYANAYDAASARAISLNILTYAIKK
jgi:hypothetical protein